MSPNTALKKKVLATLLITATALQQACSWQNTAHAIASAPGVLRLDANTVVVGAPRFTLPADAGLTVFDDHTTPAAWLDSASLGVAEVFATHADARSYQLLVRWPSQQAPQQAGQQNSTEVALLGLTAIPTPAETARLPVKLTDNHGNTIAHMTLHISPALWGPDWRDPTHLQNSFRRLAETLRDG
ncbi:MAG: hypothetical protein NXH95_00595 [Pseudomonadaceae bacterium]|nr:hypothetical protein [Pseudomonadaceae bacterium]